MMNLKERLSYLFTNSNSIKHIIIPIENDKCYYLFSEQIIQELLILMIILIFNFFRIKEVFLEKNKIEEQS